MNISITLRDYKDGQPVLEIEEDTSAMGDRLTLSTIIDGKKVAAVTVLKSDFVRVAQMFSVPYE